jgi:hypothetical protein
MKKIALVLILVLLVNSTLFAQISQGNKAAWPAFAWGGGFIVCGIGLFALSFSIEKPDGNDPEEVDYNLLSATSGVLSALIGIPFLFIGFAMLKNGHPLAASIQNDPVLNNIILDIKPASVELGYRVRF